MQLKKMRAFCICISWFGCHLLVSLPKLRFLIFIDSPTRNVNISWLPVCLFWEFYVHQKIKARELILRPWCVGDWSSRSKVRPNLKYEAMSLEWNLQTIQERRMKSCSENLIVNNWMPDFPEKEFWNWSSSLFRVYFMDWFYDCFWSMQMVQQPCTHNLWNFYLPIVDTKVTDCLAEFICWNDN